MTFTQSIKNQFTKLFSFSGRASRSEFWWSFLFSMILQLVVYIVCCFILYQLSKDLSPYISDAWAEYCGTHVTVAFVLFFLMFLSWFVVLAATWARRLHDIGLSGLLLLIPVVAFIALVICDVYDILLGIRISMIATGVSFGALLLACLLPGKPGENKYGKNPIE